MHVPHCYEVRKGVLSTHPPPQRPLVLCPRPRLFSLGALTVGTRDPPAGRIGREWSYLASVE